MLFDLNELYAHESMISFFYLMFEPQSFLLFISGEEEDHRSRSKSGSGSDSLEDISSSVVSSRVTPSIFICALLRDEAMQYP